VTVRVCEALKPGWTGSTREVISHPAAPFGGLTASGFGREGGSEGIEEYLETRYVGIAPEPPGDVCGRG
jgi:succinate-semialdehyde dehydrogenase/glutarate-semialdehyde dehydrogenase